MPDLSVKEQKNDGQEDTWHLRVKRIPGLVKVSTAVSEKGLSLSQHLLKLKGGQKWGKKTAKQGWLLLDLRESVCIF